MTRPAPVVHVERTAAAEVLRWVCHRSDLDATPVPPQESALAALIRNGEVSSVTVHAGDLLVRLPEKVDVDDADQLAAVHRTVVDALGVDGWTAPSGLTDVTIRTRRGSLSG